MGDGDKGTGLRIPEYVRKGKAPSVPVKHREITQRDVRAIKHSRYRLWSRAELGPQPLAPIFQAEAQEYRLETLSRR